MLGHWHGGLDEPLQRSGQRQRQPPRHLNGAVYVTGASSGSGSGFGALDFATVKYANNLRYTPPTNFIGTDTFTFTAVNDAGNSATGLVTVAVLPPTLQFNTAGLQFTTEGLRLQVDGARGTNPVAI